MYGDMYWRSLYLGKDYGFDNYTIDIAQNCSTYQGNAIFPDVNGGLALSFETEKSFKTKDPEISYIVRKEGKGAFFFGFDRNYADSDEQVFEVTSNSSGGNFYGSFDSGYTLLEDEVAV